VRVRVEFTVEPFREGAPGPYVDAAIAAMRADGHAVDVGPFANTVEAEHVDVAASIGRMVSAATEAGATSVSINVAVADLATSKSTSRATSQPPKVPAMTGAGKPPDPLLDLIHEVEREFGSELHLLDRIAKQRAARLLDERGAFRFRGAVEEIADAMAVSRVTIYNYLKAIREAL
jgi:uncharacterized protein YqgV (UPF0045/DUF77 family)